MGTFVLEDSRSHPHFIDKEAEALQGCDCLTSTQLSRAHLQQPVFGKQHWVLPALEEAATWGQSLC